MIRIVLVGDTLSGKSTLFDSLLFDNYYKSLKNYQSFITTVSPTFGIYLDKYIVYDTPSDKRWRSFANPYIKVADAAIVLFDAEEGGECVEEWKNYVKDTNGKDIPMLVVANVKNKFKHEKQPNVLYINCKEDVHDKLQPFLTSLQSDPRISIGLVDYLLLLLPSVEDVSDRMGQLQIPGCLQQ